jgi:hypothetical protein
MHVRRMTDTWIGRRSAYYEAMLKPFLSDGGADVLRVLLADVFVRGLVYGHLADSLEIDDAE